MKPEKVTPKKSYPEKKRRYIRPELKKFGLLKDMTVGFTPDGLISGLKVKA